MASPWPHPKTSVYYYRKQTPRHLWRERERLSAMGVSVVDTVKVSLQTRDPSKARRKFSALDAEWSRRWEGWERLLQGLPRRLSEDEVWSLHMDWRDWIRERCARDERGEIAHWTQVLSERFLARSLATHDGLEAALGDRFTLFLLKLPYRIDDVSRLALAREAWNDVVLLVAPRVENPELRLLGMMVSEAVSSSPPPVPLPSTEEAPSGSGSSLTFDGLLEVWRKATDKSEDHSSVKRFRSVVRLFKRHVGHDDALRVRVEDALAYIDHRKGDGVSHRSVWQNDISALKTLYGAAVAMRKAPHNPLAELRSVKIIWQFANA